MWPKLVQASITEAIGQKNAGSEATPPSEAAQAFLDAAAKGKASEKPLAAQRAARDARRPTRRSISRRAAPTAPGCIAAIWRSRASLPTAGHAPAVGSKLPRESFRAIARRACASLPATAGSRLARRGGRYESFADDATWLARCSRRKRTDDLRRGRRAAAAGCAAAASRAEAAGARQRRHPQRLCDDDGQGCRRPEGRRRACARRRDRGGRAEAQRARRDRRSTGAA